MTPETIAQIAALPNMNDYAAKLIFIRNSAEKAYVDDKIGEATKELLREIIELGTAAAMSREMVGVLIGNLETARNYLSAHIQGYRIAYAKEKEPEFKAKHEREKREAALAKVSGMSRLGVDMNVLSASLSALVKEKQNSSSSSSANTPPIAPAPKPIVTKVTCPSCGKETVSLKFHKC